jgi:hypothetical protein
VFDPRSPHFINVTFTSESLLSLAERGDLRATLSAVHFTDSPTSVTVPAESWRIDGWPCLYSFGFRLRAVYRVALAAGSCRWLLVLFPVDGSMVSSRVRRS